MDKKYFRQERDMWLEEIQTHSVPFWLKHSRDRLCGGYFGGLRRDGSIFDANKTSSWTMGRNTWAFSYLYNNLSQEKEWLDYLIHGIKFMKEYSLDEEGHTWGALTREGKPLARATDVYHDLYTVQAFSQAARAIGDDSLFKTAKDLAWRVAEIVFDPTINPYRPYFSAMIPWSSHPEHLILLETYQYLREVEASSEFDQIIDRIIENIFQIHYSETKQAVIEIVGLNRPLEPWLTDWVTPGHMFELVWMIINEGKHRRDQDLINKGIQICDWAWHWGWDNQYGGAYNTINIAGEYWLPGFMGHMDPIGAFKNWWVICEVIHANWLVYCMSGDDRFCQRYKTAKDWAISHYADREYGEWFGVLSIDGKQIDSGVKASDIKMCQHTLRTFYFCSKYAEEKLSQE
jgi:N-acylglucosamine 2-epimerase